MLAHTRPSVPEDAFQLAPRLRAEDVAEIEAMSGNPPLLALLNGTQGTECYSIVSEDGLVIGMYGLNHMPEYGPGQAAVWLLASPDLLSIKAQFLRETMGHVLDFHSRYPLLWNYVWAGNAAHIKWLHRLGFTFIAKHEHFGHGQECFYEFVRIPDGQH